MSRIKWTEPRLEKVKLWFEQETALNELELVKNGPLTVLKITNAGYRYFGYGSHKNKEGNIVLTQTVSCTKTRRNRALNDTVIGETVKEPITPATTGLNRVNTAIIKAFVDKHSKMEKLNNIIASFRTLGQNQLAQDLEYITS